MGKRQHPHVFTFNVAETSREQFEVLATAWLAHHGPEGDVSAALTRIDLLVMSQDRALFRHHIDHLCDGTVAQTTSGL